MIQVLLVLTSLFRPSLAAKEKFYAWSASDWGACSNGTYGCFARQREVTCVEVLNGVSEKTEKEKECNGAKPKNWEACTCGIEACDGYVWPQAKEQTCIDSDRRRGGKDSGKFIFERIGCYKRKWRQKYRGKYKDKLKERLHKWLPFYTTIDQTNLDQSLKFGDFVTHCNTLCLEKGMDVSAIRYKEERKPKSRCRCGASDQLTDIWELKQGEELVSDVTPFRFNDANIDECPRGKWLLWNDDMWAVFRYTGFYEGGSIPHQLTEILDQDLQHVEMVKTGKITSQIEVEDRKGEDGDDDDDGEEGDGDGDDGDATSLDTPATTLTTTADYPAYYAPGNHKWSNVPGIYSTEIGWQPTRTCYPNGCAGISNPQWPRVRDPPVGRHGECFKPDVFYGPLTDDKIFKIKQNIQSAEDCQTECGKFESCAYFSWWESGKFNCYLLKKDAKEMRLKGGGIKRLVKAMPNLWYSVISGAFTGFSKMNANIKNQYKFYSREVDVISGPKSCQKKWKWYVSIPYRFNTPEEESEPNYKGSPLKSKTKETFRKAARAYDADTCINMVEMPSLSENEKRDLGFIRVGRRHGNDGCFQGGGRGPGRSTYVQLGWCTSARNKGTMVHEIGHVIGMDHEQKRPDAATDITGQITAEDLTTGIEVKDNDFPYFNKDNFPNHQTITWDDVDVEAQDYRGPYLKIHWENIPDDWRKEMYRKSSTYVGSAVKEWESGEEPGKKIPKVGGYAKYDFSSIMHYHSHKKKGKQWFETIPKDAEKRFNVGQEKRLSKGDIEQLNNMYGCERVNPDDTLSDKAAPGSRCAKPFAGLTDCTDLCQKFANAPHTKLCCKCTLRDKASQSKMELTEGFAKRQCERLCGDEGFSCNGMRRSNRFFSCFQACMVRYLGATKEKCEQLANIQNRTNERFIIYEAYKLEFSGLCDPQPSEIDAITGCSMDIENNDAILGMVLGKVNLKEDDDGAAAIAIGSDAQFTNVRKSSLLVEGTVEINKHDHGKADAVVMSEGIGNLFRH